MLIFILLFCVQVLQRLKAANLKLEINECKFFVKETFYTVHTITSDRVKPNSVKTDDILEMQLPKRLNKLDYF